MAGSSSKCSLYTSVIHQSGFDCIRMIQRGQICRCEYVDIQWIILIHVIRISLLFVFIKPDSFSVSNLTIILVYIRTLMLRSPRMKPFTIHQRYSLAFSLGLRPRRGTAVPFPSPCHRRRGPARGSRLLRRRIPRQR